MITSQVLQTSIDDLKAITKIDFCIYDMEGIKNQWLKWTGADVFMWRTGLSLAKYPNKKVKLLIWIGEISKIIVIPAGFVCAIIMAIISACLNFFYLNFNGGPSIILNRNDNKTLYEINRWHKCKYCYFITPTISNLLLSYITLVFVNAK